MRLVSERSSARDDDSQGEEVAMSEAVYMMFEFALPTVNSTLHTHAGCILQCIVRNTERGLIPSNIDCQLCNLETAIRTLTFCQARVLIFQLDTTVAKARGPPGPFRRYLQKTS